MTATKRHNNKTNPVYRGGASPNKRENENKPFTPAQYSKLALIIIGTIALGLLLVNQFLEYQYNIQLLGNPCNLCEKINPEFEVVPKEVFNLTINKINNIKINISDLPLS